MFDPIKRTMRNLLLALCLLPAAALAADAGADPEQSLRQAYQREFAFLAAQKRELEEQLSRFQNEANTAERKTQQTVDRLMGEVVRLGTRVDRLNEQVDAAERAAQAVTDENDILEGTFVQADATLRAYDRSVYDDGSFDSVDKGAKIAEVFRVGGEVLAQASSVRREQGTFFTADGSKTEGTIVRVGNVAAYGVSEAGAGVLAPAGAGNLRLWQQPAGAAARAVVAGQAPQSLPLFLFENTNVEVTGDEQKTVVETIDSGGIIGWIIVALGALALLLIVLRIFFLKRASASAQKVTHEVGELVQKQQLDDALFYCKNKPGAISRVLAATVRNLDREREHLEDIVAESILHESSHLNRFGGFILVIAAVSPLLGLLGTVTGMISTFDVITEFGTGDPKLLSGGISIALVTTELGLMVAIPTLVVGNTLSGWAESIKDNMEKAALRITNYHQEGRTGAALQSAAA